MYSIPPCNSLHKKFCRAVRQGGRRHRKEDKEEQISEDWRGEEKEGEERGREGRRGEGRGGEE
jgi:hypothetical protein